MQLTTTILVPTKRRTTHSRTRWTGQQTGIRTVISKPKQITVNYDPDLLDAEEIWLAQIISHHWQVTITAVERDTNQIVQFPAPVYDQNLPLHRWLRAQIDWWRFGRAAHTIIRPGAIGEESIKQSCSARPAYRSLKARSCLGKIFDELVL